MSDGKNMISSCGFKILLLNYRDSAGNDKNYVSFFYTTSIFLKSWAG